MMEIIYIFIFDTVLINLPSTISSNLVVSVLCIEYAKLGWFISIENFYRMKRIDIFNRDARIQMMILVAHLCNLSGVSIESSSYTIIASADRLDASYNMNSQLFVSRLTSLQAR